jgi:hypothetical protein
LQTANLDGAIQHVMGIQIPSALAVLKVIE